MVNFRYHLVSLIAVFLALAVGVFLGAGPLQKAIGGETESLERQVADLNEQNSRLTATAEDLTAVAEGIRDEVVPGSLAGQTVALLLLPGVDEATATGVRDSLESGGAEVVGTIQLSGAAVALGQRDYRESLATPVSGHLPDGGAGSADQTLAAAIVEVITGTGPERNLLAEILSDDTSPLVESQSLPQTPAGAVVLVGPAGQEQPEDDDVTAPAPQMIEALGEAISRAPGGGIAVGSAANTWDTISVLRKANTSVGTVDSIGTVIAQVNAPLALAAKASEAYGVQEGATDPIAPIAR